MNANAPLVLPRNIDPSRSCFESVGFTFDETINGTYEIHFPVGWTFSPNQSSSIILDEKNRKRGFTSSGFSSNGVIKVHLFTRYSVSSKRFSESDKFSPINVYIVDADGNFVKSIGNCGTYNSEDYRQLEKQAEDYLDQEFPGWRNPAMYWDD